MKTHRLTVATLLGMLTALSHVALSSQETMPVLVGERVRITYDSNGPRVIVGLLRDIAGTAFLVAPSADRVVPIPRDQVTDIQVFRGRARQWKKGLGVGAASGAITGTLVYLLILGSFETTFGEAESVSPGVLAYTAVGALYGAGFGLGIGALFWKDRWEPVSLSNITPSFQVAPDKRFEFGFSISLRR